MSRFFAKSLLAVSLFLLAQTSAHSQQTSFSAELEVGSRYVFRGLKAGEETIHPSIEFSRDDLYAGIWSAQPLDRSEGLEEYDFYVGHGWAIGDKSYLDAGATFYYYPDADNSFEAYLGIVREMGTFTPSFYVYNDFDLEALTFELATDVVLPLEILPFESRFYIGQVESDLVSDYSYFGADFVYPVEISDSASLSLGLHYSDNDFGFGLPDEHFYGSASISVNF